MRTTLRTGALIGAMVLSVVVCRLALLSAGHLQKAEQTFTAGNRDAAATAYTWTVRNYFPGNPYTKQAVIRLQEIADQYHEEQRTVDEKLELENLRATLYSIHSFYQPYAEDLQRIETRLQQLDTPSPQS